MKYCVTVARMGCIFVEAENKERAAYIADRQQTQDISWCDDWRVSDVEEDDSLPDGAYTTEPAF